MASLHGRTHRLLDKQLKLAEKALGECESYNAELAEMITNLSRAVATFTAEERKLEAHRKKMADSSSPEERDARVRAYLEQLPRPMLEQYKALVEKLWLESEERL